MSLANIAYHLATDPQFRRTFQMDPRTAIASQSHVHPGETFTPEERSLLADLQPVLTLSPQRIRMVVMRVGGGRWSR